MPAPTIKIRRFWVLRLSITMVYLESDRYVLKYAADYSITEYVAIYLTYLNVNDQMLSD